VITSDPVNLFSLIDGASVVGASNDSYVDGPFRKTGDDAFTFPIGGAGFYQPLSISAPMDVSHEFTAQYVHSAQSRGVTADVSLALISDCEYWMLDQAIGNSDVAVTLSWQTAACPNLGYVTTLPDLRVARWNGVLWSDHGNGGTTGDIVSGTVSSSAPIPASAGWQAFTLASSTLANALPIELLEFNASCSREGAIVTWKTATEIDNDFFTLESSADGLVWTVVTHVPGAGNSQDERNYSYLDRTCFEAPCAHQTYYRLKQTDYDGAYKYSSVISLQCDRLRLFTVFPNPSNGSFTIKVAGDLTYAIKVTNSIGQVVFMGRTLGVETGVILPDLPAGVYYVTLSNAGFTKVSPMLIRGT
jgi:hypothetical protein